MKCSCARLTLLPSCRKQTHPETLVPVTVVGMPPVTIRSAAVGRMVVPRAAADHAVGVSACTTTYVNPQYPLPPALRAASCHRLRAAHEPTATLPDSGSQTHSGIHGENYAAVILTYGVTGDDHWGLV